MAASYPTSVKSFTTKQDNIDDVLAEHVNSLQDEVVAIETALGAGLTSPVVQVVGNQSASQVTCSTNIPLDNTVPQNTEGNEVLTQAITPKSATNKLRIDVKVEGYSTNQQQIVALFQDTTANALACTMSGVYSAQSATVCLTHYMDAGTTSETTFKVRFGGGTGTVYFNSGDAGAAKFGGVLKSSIIITEIKI